MAEKLQCGSSTNKTLYAGKYSRRYDLITTRLPPKYRSMARGQMRVWPMLLVRKVPRITHHLECVSLVAKDPTVESNRVWQGSRARDLANVNER